MSPKHFTKSPAAMFLAGFAIAAALFAMNGWPPMASAAERLPAGMKAFDSPAKLRGSVPRSATASTKSARSDAMKCIRNDLDAFAYDGNTTLNSKFAIFYTIPACIGKSGGFHVQKLEMYDGMVMVHYKK